MHSGAIVLNGSCVLKGEDLCTLWGQRGCVTLGCALSASRVLLSRFRGALHHVDQRIRPWPARGPECLRIFAWEWAPEARHWNISQSSWL